MKIRQKIIVKNIMNKIMSQMKKVGNRRRKNSSEKDSYDIRQFNRRKK